MEALINLLLRIPAIFIAITIHEFIRAFVSTKLGDNIPKNEGRLTLNPLKHFEPIGFVIIFATGGFGWGKPVNTSALYYKNRKKGILLTAIMPTVSNIILAFLFLLFYKFSFTLNISYLGTFFLYTATYNIGLAVYNLAPVPPMDCVKVLSAILPANTYFKYLQYEKIVQAVFLLLLFMGVSNYIFVPIINLITNFFTFIIF
ncbi:MAG: site-2 protease family protein [Lachnospiraceae bacterium]|nr:site-2 protease family protein [Lachnospiraceae bacterium]